MTHGGCSHLPSLYYQQRRNCSLMQNRLSWCLHVSSEPSQRFNNTKYCTSSLCPFNPSLPLLLIGSHLCILVTQSGPVSPWAGRPRGSGSPCADSGSVNRADGFWQSHWVWKSFILQDFFSSLLFHATPPCTKRAVNLPLDGTEWNWIICSMTLLKKHLKWFD